MLANGVTSPEMEGVTSDLNRIKTIIQKVKQLADRGIDGEKEAAQRQLNKLLLKYDLTLDDIEELEEREREFKHAKNPDARQLLAQCIFSVCGTIKVHAIKSEYRLSATMKTDQYIEVTEKYEYYWKLYKEQKAIFFEAFAQRNNLYSPEVKHAGALLDDSLDQLITMARGLKKGDFTGGQKKIE